jgi:glycosyltransferase involved in cell wall biosynthesis
VTIRYDVTVITATWRRHDNLLRYCIPTVAAQEGVSFVHRIVSDGPDPELQERLLEHLDCRYEHNTEYLELPEHDPQPHWGAPARNFALQQPLDSEFVAYADDDDLWTPDHLATLADALYANPDAGFAYSRGRFERGGVLTGVTFGQDPPSFGQFGTGILMHRACLPAE